MHTITPMVVALGPQREKSRFTYMHNFGEKVDIPYVSWLIEGGNALVLVDTGCSAESYRTRIRGDEPLRLAGETFRDVEDVKPLEEIRKSCRVLNRLHDVGEWTIPDGLMLKEDSLDVRSTQSVPFDCIRAPGVQCSRALPNAVGDGIERSAGKQLLA